MSKLRELIVNELQEGNSARVDVQRLFDAAQEHPQYTRLAGGLFLPSVGVIGEWSSEEKQVVRDIVDAREQKHSIGHQIGRALFGYDKPNVARYKDAYQTLEGMRSGDLARVRVDGSEFFLAAFPADMPARSLVLFVK